MTAKRALFVAISVCAVLVAGTTPAYAAGERYVALGDSFSSGAGAGGYSGGSCYRSKRAYPRLWAEANSPASFRFAACGGATTETVIGRQVDALAADTTLVTITVGGNDAGFGSVMRTCTLGSNRACLERIATSVAFVEQVLPAKLDATYRTIRERAPRARVVVLGYPHLFVSGPTSCGMSLTKRTALNAAADGLNAVVAGRAAAAGFTFEAVADEFAGHGVCADRPWINGVVLFPIVESYHPNAKGQRLGYLGALAGVTG